MPPQLSPEQSQSLCHHTGDMSVTVSITNNDPFHNYSHLNNHKNRIDYCCKYNGKMKWRNINSIIYSTQNEKINSILGSHKFRQPRTRTIFVSSYLSSSFFSLLDLPSPAFAKLSGFYHKHKKQSKICADNRLEKLGITV